jgi:uncharacterized membrane protein YuzA (DUF378 family)
MISQCQLVPYNPQSPEAIYYVVNGYLNQFGEVNVGLGGFISACLLSTLFPRVTNAVTWAYITILMAYAMQEMFIKYYLNI